MQIDQDEISAYDEYIFHILNKNSVLLSSY